jgi:hypothetical protein
LGRSGKRSSEGGASAAKQVEEKDYQGYDQQEMDQAAGDVETEAEKPHDQNDNKDCPKHWVPFLMRRAPVVHTGRPQF